MHSRVQLGLRGPSEPPGIDRPNTRGQKSRATGECGRITVFPGGPGIERLEAKLHGKAFSPHRHDTYAVGITTAGVQKFRFRGQDWFCFPGQCHILHPDELHDGEAGTAEGFGYRIVYVDPAIIQEALGGSPLPFVADPVLDAGYIRDRITSCVWDFEEGLDELRSAELVDALLELLLVGANRRAPPTRPLALTSLARVRELIASCPDDRHSATELEQISGLDRWELARQFRAAFGTSPSRFRVQRQLDRVRALLRSGLPLAQAAAEAGFADQSHMSRHFKAAYGLTPAKWVAALALTRA